MQIQAVYALIAKLSLIGIDPERIEIEQTEEDRHVLNLRNVGKGATIIIAIDSKYWRFPGLPCYFVNFHHTNGDMMACEGTPHVERCLFDLGHANQNAQDACLRSAK